MPTGSVVQLLESACPSIRYRVRFEILGESASSHETAERQAQILRDPAVVEVLSWQQDDGWLAWDFHGAKGIEAFRTGTNRKSPDRVPSGAHPGLARRSCRGVPGQVGFQSWRSMAEYLPSTTAGIHAQLAYSGEPETGCRSRPALGGSIPPAEYPCS